MKANAICVLSLILALSTSAQNASRNKPLCSSQDDFVVSEVIFEEANHLSPQEQAMLKLRLIGHCFESSNISDSGAYRTDFTAATVTRINKWFGWQNSVADIYVSNPPLGAKKNDLLFTTGLNVTLIHQQ